MRVNAAQIKFIFKRLYPDKPIPRVPLALLFDRICIVRRERTEFEVLRLHNKAFDHEEVKDGKVGPRRSDEPRGSVEHSASSFARSFDGAERQA